jgi:adenylate cyclase
MIMVSWAYPHDNTTESEKAIQDATQLGLQLKALLTNSGMPNDTTVRYIHHAGTLNTDRPMDSQWRGLFAQAIMKLDALS